MVRAVSSYWSWTTRIPKLMPRLDFPLPRPAMLNQDGIPDCLIGAFGQGEAGSAEALVFGWTAEDGSEHNMSKHVGSGQAFVFSGRDGQLLRSLEAPQQSAGAGFGCPSLLPET